MIRKCENCDATIQIKDGMLCATTPSTNRKGITCISRAYRVQATHWDKHGSSMKIMYLCEKCFKEAIGGFDK